MAGAEMITEANTDEISTQDENDPPVDEVEASTYQLDWFQLVLAMISVLE